jgi:electron transfer flavoprotein alpha subunit
MFSRVRHQRRLFSTLLIAESKQGVLHPANRSALAAAQKLGKSIDILILDSEAGDVQLKADKVEAIYVSTSDKFKNSTADVYSHAVNNFIKSQKKYTHVITAMSTWSKDYLPRLAAVNDTMLVSDVTEIVDESTFKRPIYAGNAIATVKSPGPIHFISARPTNFDPVVSVETGEVKSVSADDLLKDLPASVATWVEDRLKKSERPELGQAKIVVSGGRGNIE